MSSTATILQSNNELIRGSYEATTGDDYFYSLCRPRSGRRSKKCLRCGKQFISEGSGNRRCAPCLNLKIGKRQ